MPPARPPALRHALPLNSENRWSDLLAVLVETDPRPICHVLGLDIDPNEVTVRREVSVDASNRPDVVLERNGQRLAVVEVKLLSGLGVEQLDRYHEAEPGAAAYAVVFPARLVIDSVIKHPWASLTWEDLLRSHADSEHRWVAETATAWLDHLDRALPKIDATSRWGDVEVGDSFQLAMRVRMSWLNANVAVPDGVTAYLLPSSASGSWMVRMYADTAKAGYRVMVDVEEGLARTAPKIVTAESPPPKGPLVKVVLLQHGVDTSASFEWDYLHAMWPLMHAARSDWSTRAARPKAPMDRDGLERIVAKGAPPYLGFGFGDAQTRQNGECMFGPKVQFEPSITMAEMQRELEELAELVARLAEVAAPDSI